MNEIKATVRIADNMNLIEFRYNHKGSTYSIEVPKTKNNAHLKEGEEVTMLLAILIKEEW